MRHIGLHGHHAGRGGYHPHGGRGGQRQWGPQNSQGMDYGSARGKNLSASGGVGNTFHVNNGGTGIFGAGNGQPFANNHISANGAKLTLGDQDPNNTGNTVKGNNDTINLNGGTYQQVAGGYQVFGPSGQLAYTINGNNDTITGATLTN